MITKYTKMIKKLICLVLVASTLLSLCACKKDGNDEGENGDGNQDVLTPMVDPIDDNYRTFYQIFVGSFADGNRDGYGDLQGIIDHFDYLNDGDINSGKSLGVQGIWLSPIFSSPSYHKYDAKDYYQVDWRFGDEDTLKRLIDICHERNVKIILDLVINHTSSQHPWFLAFKEARMNGDTENKYYDYYTAVTAEERVGGRTYQKIAGVDCYFECNFSSEMPELNFDNPEVKEEVLKIAKYYLDLGIDGFRFDAVKYIYFGDTPSSVAFWEWYMDELVKMKSDIYCVGECWSGESEILNYYGAMNCFNFAMSQAEGFAATAAKSKNINTFTHYIESFQKKVRAVNPNGIEISFLSNHDMDRIAGAFIVDSYNRMAANLYLLSPGSPFIYYGEEIGLRGSRGGENTDANRRLAMLWGDGVALRDPVGATYPKDKQITATVADQMADENSLYNYYCKLIAIRHKHPEIARGTYTALDCSNKNLGGFLVEYNGSKIGILHNNSSAAITYDLASCTDLSGHVFTAIADAIGSGNAKLEGTVITIGAYTSVILQ